MIRWVVSVLALTMFSLITAVACTSESAPAPAATPDIKATVTAMVGDIPTQTPYPTYTPAPTAEPYPTYTPAPTLAPLPTYTPYPRPTLRPTYTPYPRPTLRPTYTPYPTPTLEPTRVPMNNSSWQETGHWYRDLEVEQGFHKAWQALSPVAELDARMATLDADPSRIGNDLYLVLGCLDSTPVGYIYPYDSQFPANKDNYKLGIWDELNGVWVDEGISAAMTFTDDEGGVYISNRAYLREIVSLLKRASSGLPEEQYLSAILYDSNTEGTADYWSGFNTAGIADTLRYLGCH